MNRSARLGVATIALSTLAGLATNAHAVTFFDGIFNDPDWSLTVFNNATGVGSTSSGLQFLAGGNPNEYRRVRNQLLVQPPGNGSVIGFHMRAGAFYNPSTQGAITSIDYSEDSINFVPTAIVPGNGQGTGLAILQGGVFYRQQNPILVMPFVTHSNWTLNQSLGLLAADFAEVTPAGVVLPFSNPDFSVSGAVMQFGFWRGNSGNGGYNTDCGIDNWHVNIVPAPGAAALLGLGGLLVARRRR